MCELFLATRGKSLSEQFCCEKFPEQMVFMFSSGVDQFVSFRKAVLVSARSLNR